MTSATALAKPFIAKMYFPKADDYGSGYFGSFPPSYPMPDMYTEQCKSKFDPNPYYPPYPVYDKIVTPPNISSQISQTSSTSNSSLNSSLSSSMTTSLNISTSREIYPLMPVPPPNTAENKQKLQECLEEAKKQNLAEKEKRMQTDTLNSIINLGASVIYIPFHVLIFRPRKR